MTTRREFMKAGIGAGALLALGARRAVGLPQSAESPLKTLRGNMGTFEQQGGTILWLDAGDALAVVDTQFPDSAGVFWSAIAGKGERKIDLLMNSHHHGDHTGGMPVLKPHALRSVAQKNVPDLQRRQMKQRGIEGEPVTADELFETEWTADLGKESVHARHYGPGHTAGDAVIHFQHADIAHMGDLVFNRMPAFIDRSAGASISGWIDRLETLHKSFSDSTMFVYGHGNPAYGISGGRADMLVMRDFLSGLLDYTRKGIAEGRSKDDLARIEKLPGFPEHFRADWVTAIPLNIAAAYEELTEE